ncbi:hypothetical protein P9209_23670 [Prescottella defluvii]|nr:hypothetical protein P9209_23670 [Prescottella defluvii]
MEPTTRSSAVVLETVPADETGPNQHRRLAMPVPGICVAHGLPATNTATFLVRPYHKIMNDSYRDAVPILPGGFWDLLTNSLSRLREQPSVQTTWPLCSRCEARRSRCLRAAAILAACGPVLIMVSVGLGLADLRGPATTASFLTGLAFLPLALAFLTATRPDKLFHAAATPDGSAVIVTDPHPKFAAAIRAIRD